MMLHKKNFEEQIWSNGTFQGVPRVRISDPNPGYFFKTKWAWFSRVWRSVPFQIQHWRISSCSEDTRLRCEIKYRSDSLSSGVHQTKRLTQCRQKSKDCQNEGNEKVSRQSWFTILNRTLALWIFWPLSYDGKMAKSPGKTRAVVLNLRL